MKKFFSIFLALVVFASCVRIEYGDDYRLRNTTLIFVEKLSNIRVGEVIYDFETNLTYNWDEETWGKIVEAKIDTVICYVMNGENAIVDTLDVVCDSERNRQIIAESNYDLLLSNKSNSVFQHETPNDFMFYVDTLDYTPFDFEFTNKYKPIAQCQEQYSDYIENVIGFIDLNKLDEYKLISDVGDTYVYEVEVQRELKPVSYVYVIQVVIYDDDHKTPFSAKSCDYMALSGVARSCDLKSRTPGSEAGLIELTDIKPIQETPEYQVFCSKVITYGIPRGLSSWDEGTTCELGIELTMIDGSKKRGRVDITNLIEYRPYGGVLTVPLRNSEVSVLSGDTIESGSDVNVENWGIYIFDIPF